ncbi:TolC family protein [bacterium CPR1]|nr:TolC family protein [bacterium CPR1]
MIRLLLVLLLTGMALAQLPDSGLEATPASPLSLEAALSEAAGNSPAIREAEARVQEAIYGVDEAGAPGKPRVDFSAGYQYLTPTLSFSGLPVVVNNNYEFAVGLQQTLADFGRLHWATASAELRQRSLTEKVRRQKEDLAMQVRQAYAGLLFARQSLTVASDLVAAQKAHVQVVETRLKAGAVPRYDMLSSQAALARAEEQLVTARSQESLARQRLLMLLGRSLEQPLELADWPAEMALPDLAEGATRALVERPELTALNWAVEAARARVHLEESQDNPALSFATRYAQRNETAFQNSSLWSAGVLFSVPLFDGGASEARANQAEAVVVQLGESQEKLRRLVALEVQESYQQLLTASEQLRLSSARLEQTTEGLRIARLRYQTGVSINQEVLDAESAQSQARLDRHRAELALRSGWARWLRVCSVNAGPAVEPAPAPPR